MTDTATGATPAAGATPATPPPATPPAPDASSTPPAPAPEYPDGLGDAGKRALDAMKAERKAAADRAAAAERERDEARKRLEELEAASQSEQEKALKDARREARDEERARWEVRIRRAEVRSSLRTAGLTNEKALGLAAAAPEFSELKVGDDGSVEGLADAVAAFQKDYPELFQSTNGTVTRGPVDGDRPTPKTLHEAIAAELATH